MSQTSADYRASPLSQTQHAGGKLRGGDRVPDLDVQASAAEPVPLYSLLDPSRFTLLLTNGAALPADWSAQFGPWQELLAVQAIAPAPAAADAFTPAFGPRAGLLLVRPDAYLALVANAEGWPALLAWLQRWLPRAN